VTQSVPYLEGADPPPHGGGLAYKQNFSSLLPSPDRGEPLQQFWFYSLTVGQTRTVFCEAGVPEYWHVTVVGASGVQLAVWNGSGTGGDPIVIGGGGTVKFNANNEYVTIQARLGSPIGNVAALRHSSATIDPGDMT
jgi:hypothetical protein